MDTGRTVSFPHKGWYSRGYLPHLDQPGLVQAVTFRLDDSMPAERRHEWEALLKVRGSAQQHERIQDYLDAGHGSCVLRHEHVASLVQAALLHGDDVQYRLLAWVVMPNHVHVLAEMLPGCPLYQVVQAWKSVTARRANALLGRKGTLWQRDYFDRYIRDERHMERAIVYIHGNPVKAGLVARAEDWPFGSARWTAALDEALGVPG